MPQHRLRILCYSREVQEVAFLMVHNKLPVFKRLFRINLADDLYCQICPSACIQDTAHFFITCERVAYYWNWLKGISCKLLARSQFSVDDSVLLNFHWPRSKKDQDLAWLIGHYIFVVWEMLHNRKLNRINDREFFGFLRYKYRKAMEMDLVSGGLW